MLNIVPNVPDMGEKTEKKFTGLSRQARILRGVSLYVPAFVMTIIVLTAIFADLSWIGLPQYGLAPHDPNDSTPRDRLLPPAFMEEGQPEYLLGTDRLGRDVLSRVIHGARISLSVSLLVIAITASIGTVLGITAGLLGGRTEGFIMRVVDVALSFPALILALLIATIIGPGYLTVVLALSVLGWAGYTRLVRAESMRITHSDFVAQARVNGASSIRIMVRHIFPNVLNSLIIVMTISVGAMIIAESTLSFLGIGISAPIPSWGSMVADGRAELDRAWWISAFPGIAIGLVVLSMNFLGDWIRDKFDPRLRQQ